MVNTFKSNKTLINARRSHVIHESLHEANMESTKNIILEGTSKWSAKIAIKGLLQKPREAVMLSLCIKVVMSYVRVNQIPEINVNILPY